MIKIFANLVNASLACCVIGISLGEPLDKEKRMVNVKMPTDPTTAHTLYLVSIDKHGERRIERIIRVGQPYTPERIKESERQIAKEVKQFGLSGSGKRYLISIHAVVLPDGSVFQSYNVFHMIGDLIVLEDGFMNYLNIRELIEKPEKKGEQTVPSDGHTPTSHASSTDPTAPADAH
jgi:hypothetical protein